MLVCVNLTYRVWILVAILIMNNTQVHGEPPFCYVCGTSTGNEACNSGGPTQCNSNEICSNEIRDENNQHKVTKTCKQDQACWNEVSNNNNDCHPSTEPSVCRYCCTTDNCNLNENPSATSEVQTTNTQTTAPQTTTPKTAGASWGDTQTRLKSGLMANTGKGESNLQVIRVFTIQSNIRCGLCCMWEATCVSMRFYERSSCSLYGIVGSDDPILVEMNSGKIYHKINN